MPVSERPTDRHIPEQARPRIIARVSPTTRAELQQLARSLDLRFSEAATDVARASLDGPACVIWEILPWDAGLPDLLPLETSRVFSQNRVIVRCQVSRPHMRWVAKLAVTVPDFCISLCEFDNLIPDIRALLKGDAIAEAYPSILASLPSELEPAVQEVIAAAVIAGRRRVSTDAFLARCGWQARTVQARLRKASLPSPHIFLAWSMVLHTVWRMEVLGLPAKRAAYLAGYSGSSANVALGEYLHGHVGLRLRESGTPGTFAGLLHQFGNLLRPVARTKNTTGHSNWQSPDRESIPFEDCAPA